MLTTYSRHIRARSRNCFMACICVFVASSYLGAATTGQENGSIDDGKVRFEGKRGGTSERIRLHDEIQKEPLRSGSKPKDGQTRWTIRLTEISYFLERWKSEWENKNLQGLMDLCDPGYKVGPVDYNTLQNRKRSSFNKYETIEVQLQDIQIEKEVDRIRIDFVQSFRADGYADKGHKTLLVARDSTRRSRIISEHWTPLEKDASDHRFTKSESRTAVHQRQSKLSRQEGPLNAGKSTREQPIGVQNHRELMPLISEECEAAIHKSENCPELRVALVRLLRKLRPLRRKQLRLLYLSEAEESFLNTADLEERCIEYYLETRCLSKTVR